MTEDNESVTKDQPKNSEEALKDISKQLRIQNMILRRIVMALNRRR